MDYQRAVDIIADIWFPEGFTPGFRHLDAVVKMSSVTNNGETNQPVKALCDKFLSFETKVDLNWVEVWNCLEAIRGIYYRSYA
jgi:hypothetical protein